MARRASSGQSTGDLAEWSIWFPDENGDPIVADPPVTVEDVVRDLRHTVGTVVEQVKDTNSTPGYRLGGTGDQPDRRGSGAEVVTSLLVRPAAAAELALSGALFTPPLTAMTVEDATLDAAWPSVECRVSVQTGIRRRHRASLLIHPTPSSNITVIELLPDRISRWRTRAFVRAGVSAVDTIAARLLAHTGGGLRS